MLYQVEQRGRQTAFVGEDGAGLVGLYPLLARAAAIAENENSSFAEALSLAAAERGTPLRRVSSNLRFNNYIGFSPGEGNQVSVLFVFSYG